MIVQPDRAIRSICVVGAGITGLSAAIAFARSLPMAAITLLATSPDPANLTDRLPRGLLAMRAFQVLIGLTEVDLVQSGAATHRLGMQFRDWSANGASWTCAHGEYGMPADGVAFHQLWVAARAKGDILPFHDYSMAAVLANVGKFVHPTDGQGSPLATFDYALRLDPARYQEKLDAICSALRINRVDGEVTHIERRADGGISSLTLASGQVIAADLYVDCAGPAAPLLSKICDAFDDWGKWFPCDRLTIAERGGGEPRSSDHVSATDNGWCLDMPMTQGALEIATFASAFAADPKGKDAIGLRYGTRPEPWSHNVLALGDAAIVTDPLLPVNLTLLQNAVTRALSLLPGRDCHPVELREYNRRTAQEALRVRDFAALHYLRSGRRNGALWQEMASVTPPDSLAHTLDQFETRGRLPFYEEEIFDRHSWLSVLLGMGVMPDAVDPASRSIDGKAAAKGMVRLADGLRDIERQVPPYPDYLARLLAVC
jgi:tryptophan 7-halogenase